MIDPYTGLQITLADVFDPMSPVNHSTDEEWESFVEAVKAGKIRWGTKAMAMVDTPEAKNE